MADAADETVQSGCRTLATKWERQEKEGEGSIVVVLLITLAPGGSAPLGGDLDGGRCSSVEPFILS